MTKVKVVQIAQVRTGFESYILYTDTKGRVWYQDNDHTNLDRPGQKWRKLELPDEPEDGDE
jgi:hypothetical protein